MFLSNGPAGLGHKPTEPLWTGDTDAISAFDAVGWLPERRAAAAAGAFASPLAAEIAILDEHWHIVAVNAAWRAFAVDIGHPAFLAIGRDLRAICERAVCRGVASAGTVLDGMRAIADGEPAFGRTARSTFDGRHRHVSLTPLHTRGRRYAILARQDVEELFTASAGLHTMRAEITRLHAGLARVREEERERIARDLHDGVAQWLVGIKLGLAHLRQLSDCPAVGALANEMSEAIAFFQAEVRALSLGLQPPQLDHGGLHRAVRMLCAGFAQRSGAAVTVHVHGTPAAVPGAADATAYRLVQEALGNVQKHARARHVRVRIVDRAEGVLAVVADDGVGLPDRPDPANDDLRFDGFGIPGMIARVRDAGGRISVHNRANGRGTIMIALVPRTG